MEKFKTQEALLVFLTTENDENIAQRQKATKSLSLCYARFAVLPPEIEKLKNLEHLSLRASGITSLPPEIGNLTKLKYLDLAHTSIQALPPEIGKLQNLEKLDLQASSVTQLPYIWEIANFKKYLFKRINSLLWTS